MDRSLLSAINEERQARRAAIVVTDVTTGVQRLVKEAEASADVLASELLERFRTGRSGLLDHDGTSFFLNVQSPPVKLIAIGAVHISQALAPMAKEIGLDVTIIDPRTAFATAERFPDVRVLAEWPEDALPKLGGLDRYSALVCLTHDPKIDDPALQAGLRAACFYIGALGSRRTHGKRVERLESAGFGADDLSRIHAPIGLDIGAVSPAEIAVSILAELVANLRQDRRRRA